MADPLSSSQPIASSSKVVSTTSGTSGLAVDLHPLPILSISEHYTRSSLQYGKDRMGPSFRSSFASGTTLTFPRQNQVLGALLGTQSGREVSIVNSFELSASVGSGSGDVVMDGSTEGNANGSGEVLVDMDFLERRREQFKQVFPTLDLIGWYTVSPTPTHAHVKLHSQFLPAIESPLLLLLSPSQAETTSLDLPLNIYESALGTDAEGGKGDPQGGNGVGKLVELEYTISTGEAERIAVEGAAKAGDEGEDSGVVANLTTQRNAIQMLHDRMKILLEYVTAVINKKAQVDDALLRDIAAVVSTLPAMQTKAFYDEFNTEKIDVRLTSYLSTLTKSLAELNDLTDKFKVINSRIDEDGNAMRARQGPGGRAGMGALMGGMRRGMGKG